MAGKKSKTKRGYTVPESERKAYKMLVQKANRHIKSNLKLIDKYSITDRDTKRVLLNMYENRDNWNTKSTPLSRSVKFSSKTEYNQYIKHLEKMANSSYQSSIKGYKQAVLVQLERIAIEYNIAMPNGKLTKEIKKAVNSMTLEQLVHWFNMGDVTEDIESQQYGSDDYAYATDWEDFVDTTMTRIADLIRVYPNK